MDEKIAFWIVIALTIIELLAIYYDHYLHPKDILKLAKITFMVGAFETVLFKITKTPNYWFWIPGILIGGYILIGVIIILVIGWFVSAMEKNVGGYIPEQ